MLICSLFSEFLCEEKWVGWTFFKTGDSFCEWTDLWLRHYATDRKVAGLIFSLPNPSSRTVALGSTQPLTEMRIKNILGGKGRPARKADYLTAVCEPIIYKMWEPQPFTNLWASTACYRHSFAFLPFYWFMVAASTVNLLLEAGNGLCFTQVLDSPQRTGCNDTWLNHRLQECEANILMR
jgi:hypothetical protein